ncbi:cellulase family glycosylhydrolase [Streptacidiphilus carbonis]|uniref:cellulase family glycosylhydrolase n=1 Tax=Streptacidiphilus carbonis TaxID=105422 RepID=UPI000A03857F|nr:cellulase family glycosylhydrolase [Streptacidiphilus carbonis]
MRSRTTLLLGTAAAVTGFTAALLPLAASSAAATAVSCSVSYSVGNDWGSGFTAAATITDTGGSAIPSWTLTYTTTGNQTLQSGWNGTWSQTGHTVTVAAPSWSSTIAAGGSVTTNANFGYSNTNSAPTGFAVNGVACGGPGTPSATPTTAPPTTAPPTTAPPTTAPPTTAPPTTAPPTNGTAPALHVSGNKLVNASGSTVTLHGVNRSGAEFACVQGTGIFDGPVDQTSVAAMASWHINAVRVPLNEDCWNGESNVLAAYSGANYINAIKAYVTLLHQNGLVAILDLHWTDGVYSGNSSACSTATATCQKPMPDAAQAIPFWTSVANTFKGDNSTVFDLFNEPYPDRATSTTAQAWTCWRDGGTCSGINYQVAGMQSMVNAVRGTGASNVLMLGGLAYSNDLTQWLTYEPTDPDHDLAASWHSYNFNTCSNSSCWTSQISPVLAQVPLVTGELGENDCAHGYLDTLLPWLDNAGASYLAWTWNTWDCSSGPSLISNYDGTATAYGAGYKAHLAALG